MRAKQRVVFAYCDTHGTRMQIAPLCTLLLQGAGVKTPGKV
jgi:hypothetical protein